MARRPRVILPGVPSHVYLRGNDRQDIFRCDGDRLALLTWLRDASSTNGLAVHAWVLMTNHLHLLATPAGAASLARTIQDMGRKYVRYFNRRYDRTGTLFEGRFKSTVVQAERYYVMCHRYVESNPVRAGMVATVADYPWSSYRHYAQGIADPLVTPHELVNREGHAFLHEQDLRSEEIALVRTCTHEGWALGDADFCARAQAHLGFRVSPLGRGNGDRHDSRRGLDEGGAADQPRLSGLTP